MSQKKGAKEEEEMELRRGPWTLEEDSLLIHYIACHGEGRWNLLARCSGLKRTGKSCRLRWLNYLKPDVKRGNLTAEEQFLILELHSKWGNRWSRIAQHLPGRTDNEIKNYWRTRVQKQARQLKIDANSSVFRDAIRYCWMPRLLEKMVASPSFHSLHPIDASSTTANQISFNDPAMQLYFNPSMQTMPYDHQSSSENCSTSASTLSSTFQVEPVNTALNTFMAMGNLAINNEHNFGASMSIPEHCYPASASDCGAEIMDGLWPMDELWHARKLHDYGDGI